MPELANRLGTLPVFELEEAESALRTLAAEKGVKAGLLINAARALLTGRAVAPGIFEVMVALGRERTVARLSETSWVESEPRAGTGVGTTKRVIDEGTRRTTKGHEEKPKE